MPSFKNLHLETRSTCGLVCACSSSSRMEAVHICYFVIILVASFVMSVSYTYLIHMFL